MYVDPKQHQELQKKNETAFEMQMFKMAVTEWQRITVAVVFCTEDKNKL